MGADDRPAGALDYVPEAAVRQVRHVEHDPKLLAAIDCALAQAGQPACRDVLLGAIRQQVTAAMGECRHSEPEQVKDIEQVDP